MSTRLSQRTYFHDDSHIFYELSYFYHLVVTPMLSNLAQHSSTLPQIISNVRLSCTNLTIEPYHCRLLEPLLSFSTKCQFQNSPPIPDPLVFSTDTSTLRSRLRNTWINLPRCPVSKARRKSSSARKLIENTRRNTQRNFLNLWSMLFAASDAVF